MDGKRNKKSNIICASEIGQFHFCPVSWYLQRQGFEPDSPFLEYGVQRHENLGHVIKKTQRHISISKILIYSGIFGIIIAFLLIIIEVILSML